MRTFTRDTATNDIVFARYAAKTSNTIQTDASVDEGGNAVGDVLEAIVKTEYGELDLDTTAGIHHVALLANGSSVLPFWKKDMSDAVMRSGYVNSIDVFDVDYDRDNHEVAYRMSVSTDFGTADVSGGDGKSARVLTYAAKPNLEFETAQYPDSRYDATVLKFDFITGITETGERELVIRVEKADDADTVTVYWMDGERDVVRVPEQQTLRHSYRSVVGGTEVSIGHGAKWLAVGENGTGGDDFTRKTICDIGRFSTTISSLDNAFVHTRLKKEDYQKPANVSDESWNSAFSQ